MLKHYCCSAEIKYSLKTKISNRIKYIASVHQIPDDLYIYFIDDLKIQFN